MSQLDREGLISQSNFLFPDNTTREITPADLRTFNTDVADSLTITGSLVPSASYAISSSQAENANTAISASHAILADNAIEIFVSAKNTSGFDIPKGTAVHSSGVTGENININTASYDNPTLMPAIGITQEAITNNAVGDVILTGRIQGINTSNLTEGATVYVNGDGSLTSTKPTGSALIQNIGTCVKSNATEGEVLVLGSGRTNDLPNIQSGYAWVGNVDQVPTAVSTASWDAQADLTELNAFTASYYIDSASFDTRIDNIVDSGLISSSDQVTASLDTRYEERGSGIVSSSAQITPLLPTGTISGSEQLPSGIISGSTQVIELLPTGTVSGSQQIIDSLPSGTVSGSDQVLGGTGIVSSSVQVISLLPTGTVSGSSQVSYPDISNIPSGIVSGSDQLTGSFATLGANTFTAGQIITAGNLELTGTGQIINNPNGTVEANEVAAPTALFNKIEPNTETRISITSDLEITGSVTASQGIRASEGVITTGNLEFTNASPQILNIPNGVVEANEVATQTLLTNTIEVNTGTEIGINSNLIISGSTKTETQVLTITSLTASLDFNQTDMHELTLVASTDTHLTATNVGKGQTINVLVKQASGGSGTLSFDTEFLQPSGSSYTATSDANAEDILTLVTFNDTNKIYVAAVNKLQ